MPSSLAVLALALAAAPPPVAPATAAVHVVDPVTPSQSRPAPPAAPSRSAFGAAIAEMTRSLQAEAAAERDTAKAPDTAAMRTAAADRDE